MYIYLDCKNGVSSDMLLEGVKRLYHKLCSDETCGKVPSLESILINIEMNEEEKGQHGRSLPQVNAIIENLKISKEAKELGKKIYYILGIAEAKVHEKSLDTVHFHEVGRNQAIENVANYAQCITYINPKKLYVNRINDGKGVVKCSHGEIGVPVPAVKALMENCDLQFGIRDVEGERVTPTALAMLIGSEATYCEEFPNNIVEIAKCFGARDPKKVDGLILYGGI